MTASVPAVVRVAPSPTGDPHVGTAYMALFNWLEAHSTGGKFILRIEDTDRTRYDASSEQKIMETLGWLGLQWDEGPDRGGPSGPYRQSERTEIYRAHMERLLDRGHAYRCFCTEERLEEMRAAQKAAKAAPGYDGLCRGLLPEEIEQKMAAKVPYVTRLKVPKDRAVRFHDELRGEVTIEGHTIDDQVLMKSDGFPTYHLANVVDDRLMGVTKVIRAEEWIVSTPKHVLLYEAFGWPAPAWRHMPLLRNADKSKISKRKNPTSLTWYQEQGYLPEALVNFLGLMGYSSKDGQEVFSLEQMLADYDAKRLSTSGPVFDLEKLGWLNGEHTRLLSVERLTARVLEHMARRKDRGLVVAGTPEADVLAWIDAHGGTAAPEVEARVRATVPLVRERMRTLREFAPLVRCFFVASVKGYAPEDLIPKKGTLELAHQMLAAARDALTGLHAFDAPTVEAALRALAEAKGWKVGDLFAPLRVAVTGAKVSPPLFESMALLGREVTLARLAV
jgi:glutamyl-tRNA synthetase